MVVKMKANATLQDLDTLLRDIWLECCGHLSEFQIDQKHYESNALDDMNVTAKMVLSDGTRFIHEYDYGSTTRLSLEVHSNNKNDMLGMKEPVEILARNLPGKFKCHVCKKRATSMYFDDEYVPQYVCSKCSGKYEDEYDIHPVVNSPRMGICGYE